MKDYTNYHNINLNNKITNDSRYILDRQIQGYAGFDVQIGQNRQSRILRFERTDSNGSSYKIIGYEQDIERGNLITLNNEIFLITTKPQDKIIYKKAIMEFCQTTFELITDGVETEIDKDKLNRPIYEYTQSTIENIPCIVETNKSFTRNVDVNQSINLLDNQIRITIPYRVHDKLNYNETFNLYRDNYRIIGLDESEQVNGIGLLRIIAQRVENRRT